MSIFVHTLPNGLEVITDYVPYSALIMVQVWVKSGSRAENDDSCGLAHFLEHMAFKGTSTRNAQDLAVAFDALGAVFNAQTDKESTIYYVKVLKENFDAAIELLADIMINSVFDEQEMMREKSVVLEEIAETNDDPATLLFDKFIEHSFLNQQVGRSILGTKDTVMNFTRESLLDFICQNYSSKNVMLIVSGNIMHEKVVEKVNYFFSRLISNDNFATIEKAHHTPSLECYEDRDLEQVHLILGTKNVPLYDDLYYAMKILSLILGGSMSSRLFQEVREKRGLVYSIYSFNVNYCDCGVFGIYACATPYRLRELLEVTIFELNNIKVGFLEEELERAKTQLRAGLLMKMEGLAGRCSYIGSCFQYLGYYLPIEDVVSMIDSVNVEKLYLAVNLVSGFTKPTIAAIGKLDALPRYSELFG